MLTFMEFDRICRHTHQVLQSVLLLQAHLRSVFFGKKFWVKTNSLWTKVRDGVRTAVAPAHRGQAPNYVVVVAINNSSPCWPPSLRLGDWRSARLTQP